MKHIIQALAKVNKAQLDLETDYEIELSKFKLQLERKYAAPRQKLQGAKKALQTRLLRREAIIEDYYGQLKADTPRPVNDRLKRSLQRERERRARYE